MTDKQVTNDTYPIWSMEIPLTSQFFEIARVYAQEQQQLEQRSRVRLNTLAVLATRLYLQFHHIETEVEAGDAWNPAIRAIEDIADLPVPSIGTLECRPILPGQTTVELPVESWFDRIGYLVVEIDETKRVAHLLGFAEPISDLDNSCSTLSRDTLRSLDDMHEFFERRQWIQKQIDSVFSPLKQAIPDEMNQAQLSTSLAWVSLRDHPRQWRRQGIKVFDHYRQETLLVETNLEVGMLDASTEVSYDMLRDLVGNLFNDLRKALKDDSPS